MSETKHTPPPLEVATMSYFDAMALLIGREVRAIVDSDRKIVAIVFGTNLVAIPDANLFAAAPDLLEACEVALKYFESCVSDCYADPDDMPEETRLLRAAIALAKGEAK